MADRDPAGADELSLGLGLFSMPLPDGWEFKAVTPVVGFLRMADGTVIRADVWSVEDPEAIAAQDVAPYLAEDGMPIPDGPLDALLDNLLVGRQGATASGGETLLWKSVSLFEGRLLRVARLAAELEQRLDAARAAALMSRVSAALLRGRFSPGPTPFDRVAITPDLMVRNILDRIFLRVPPRWELGYEDDGRPGFEAIGEAVSPDTTLWVNYDDFPMPGSDAFGVEERQAAANSFIDMVGLGDSGARQDMPDGAWVESDEGEREEKGLRLRFRSFRRIAIGANGGTIAHFNLVLMAEEADSEAAQALIARVREESQRAVVLTGPIGPDGWPG